MNTKDKTTNNKDCPIDDCDSEIRAQHKSGQYSNSIVIFKATNGEMSTKIKSIDDFKTISAFNKCTTFYVDEFSYTTIHQAISGLAGMKFWFPVMGKLSDKAKKFVGDGNYKIPRKKLEHAGKTKPSLEEGSSNLFILEIDDLKLEGYDASDPVPALKKYLKSEGIDCDITAQLSASQQPNSEQVKAHLIGEYCNNFPLNLRLAHAITFGHDVSIHNGVNPVYIAPPLFHDKDGNEVADPIGERIFYIEGKVRCLDMPSIDELEPLIKKRGMLMKRHSGNMDKFTLTYPNPEQAVKDITSGKNYHFAHIYLTMRYANQKHSSDKIFDMIATHMDKVEVKDDRWQVRVYELKGLCDTAVEIVNANPAKRVKNRNAKLVDYKAKGMEVFTNVDWPPGFLGELAVDIWEMMTFPNKQIAIVAAHMVTGAFAGRKNSFGRIDLSISFEMLGMTAIGKDTPRWALEHLIDTLRIISGNIESLTKLDMFEPLAKSFGLKALIDASISKLSLMLIYAEAGIASETSAGDQSSVNSFIMQNQASGAYEKLHIPPYSQPIPPIYGVPIILLYESTKTSHNADVSSFSTGEYGRKFKFHCTHRPDRTGVPQRAEFSHNVVQGIMNMYKEAVRGEDFKTKVKAGNIKIVEYMGASLIPIDPRVRVEFECDEEAGKTFNDMREAEFVRRENAPIVVDDEREWAEESRYEFRVRKQCLFTAYADYAAYGHEPIISQIHTDYAEHFVREIDRAERENESDYSSNDVLLVNEIENWCHAQLDKKEVPVLFINNQNDGAGSKGAREIFNKRIVFKKTLFANNTSKPMKIANSIADKALGRAEVHRIMDSAFRNGASEGKWIYFEKDDDDNDYGLPCLQFNVK